MGRHQLILAGIYALGTLAAVGCSAMLWRYRERTGARALIAMMAAMVIWNVSLLVFTSTGSPAIAGLAIRILFIGVAFVTLAKLVFVLEYTGRDHLLRPGVLGPLAVPPVLTLILVFVNPADLYFTTIEPASDGLTAVEIEFGPAALVPLLYSYGLNLIITGFVLGYVYRSRAIYRGQSLALLGGALTPWIANMVYVADLVQYDVTAIGSVASGLLFAIAITRYRLFDVMPIARHRVLDHVNDGIFVVDEADRLVDVNPRGREMLAAVGVDTDALVGRSFPRLFDEEKLRERYDAATAAREETTEHVTIGEAHFRVTATPIEDGRDRHVGWLLIAHDVTDQKRREQQLERQNQRLERFASLVSHDLRNPLNVASGYLDMALEADDEAYLEEIERSHERMETIIEDVLALAREGADVTDPAPVALADVARRAWTGVDTELASVSIDAGATILADPDRLRRLLENLFRNAVEHGAETPDGSDLRVRVGTIDPAADGSFGIFVEDDGRGVPADDRERVLEDGYTTGDEGTGLGLSIVESIAAAHGWSVAVAESDAGGARFEFTGVERVLDDRGATGTSGSVAAPAASPDRTKR